jgi:hypothetical protein
MLGAGAPQAAYAKGPRSRVTRQGQLAHANVVLARCGNRCTALSTVPRYGNPIRSLNVYAVPTKAGWSRLFAIFTKASPGPKAEMRAQQSRKAGQAGARTHFLPHTRGLQGVGGSSQSARTARERRRNRPFGSSLAAGCSSARVPSAA